MKISKIEIRNFRGIKNTEISFNSVCVLLGDNNTGKTTVLEAVDLALGPDRLRRNPTVDEHDFYIGRYFSEVEEIPMGKSISEKDFSQLDKVFTDDNDKTIAVLVQLSDLSEDQKIHFGGVCEFYSKNRDQILDSNQLSSVDDGDVTHCVRILFLGYYDYEIDDFVGNTYYYKDLLSGELNAVDKRSKQFIGFLYLRSLRTGGRALSLERGSLLDIVLRTCEVRPQMWESVLFELKKVKIPSDDEDELGSVLTSVQKAINRYVPKEWGTAPTLRVSRMTREDLRRTILAFIETQDGHQAPFYRQGTGTTNMMVLALLSIIRDNKQNVIFAMEEPETAIPPHAQKQIVSEVIASTGQAIFTSHSPYVIEEFSLGDISILSQGDDGFLSSHHVSIRDSGSYDYHQYFRSQLCEGLLARRIVVCEGITEVSILTGLSRHLEKLNSDKYRDLAALGYCMVNSLTDSQILNHIDAFGNLGKYIVVFCDAQDSELKTEIESLADKSYIHNYRRVEDLLLAELPESAKEKFAETFEWPQYVLNKVSDPKSDLDKALKIYLKKTKGSGGAVHLLSVCSEEEVPLTLKQMISELTEYACPEMENVTNSEL